MLGKLLRGAAIVLLSASALAGIKMTAESGTAKDSNGVETGTFVTKDGGNDFEFTDTNGKKANYVWDALDERYEERDQGSTVQYFSYTRTQEPGEDPVDNWDAAGWGPTGGDWKESGTFDDLQFPAP